MDAIIKTAVIEKRRDWREKLVSLIDYTPGFKCAGNYGSLDEALRGFDGKLPDIVLYNFRLADEREKKAVRALRAKYPQLPVLILNFYDEESVSETATRKKACLLKITMPSDLARAAAFSAGRGKNPVFGAFMTNILRLLHDFLPAKEANCILTPHEKRLLELLVEGHNHTTAAKALNVSYNTVKFHMRRIYQKLEVNSKSAAVAKALRHCLIN